MWEGRKKPDLRHCRWRYGLFGDKYSCIELEVPDTEVLLSDFDLWHMVLNDEIISFSEKEDDILQEKYNRLSKQEQREFKNKNWQEIFNTDYFENDWIIRGTSIQATMWEIKKEYIKNVKFFTAATNFL